MVRVAFLWHMHQPTYRDPLDGTVILPWVRLHALKDYLGMVRILDETPTVHTTFNLVPVLVDQVEACARGEYDDPHQQASMAPAAEMVWPIIDFVELTRTAAARAPNTCLIAAVSTRSFIGVDVPWALT